MDALVACYQPVAFVAPAASHAVTLEAVEHPAGASSVTVSASFNAETFSCFTDALARVPLHVSAPTVTVTITLAITREVPPPEPISEGIHGTLP